MRLFLLICLTMLAFASNSLLTRVAVDSGAITPGSFAAIRVAAGAAALLALARWRVLPASGQRRPGARRVIGAAALALYMLGFSLAYVTLDAGLGALILFGTVQGAMFGYGVATGATPGRQQWLGAFAALSGLAYVLWPVQSQPVDPGGAAFMVLAGLGWAAYTLAGRGESDALAASAGNFLLALPVVGALPLLGGIGPVTATGVGLAILSGAVTSGLGYALWYAVLPRLTPAFGATVQLSVPVIALIGGALLLGETLGIRFVIGAAVILGGIALSLRRGSPR